MNKIVYNRDDLLKDFLNCNNGEEILQQIKASCEYNKEVICGLSINGKDISEQEEAALVKYQLKDLQVVEIETCPYDEFYGEFVASSKNFIKDIAQICPFVVEAAQGADYAKFEELFLDFISSMESLTSALQYIQNKQKHEGEQKDWLQREASLSDVLQQMFESYSAKDYVNLADLIEYEMIVELKKWHNILEKIEVNARNEGEKKAK